VKRHRASGVAPDGPWREKEVMLGVLCDYYGIGPERIFSEFALGRRTLWGTEIPTDRLQRRETFPSALIRAGLANLSGS
jgi:hypothetical protein